MRRSEDKLLSLVQSYFQDNLVRVRGASKHTVRSFQDALRLFFTFLAGRLGRSLDHLRLDDVRADAVLAFLAHVESVRHNSARSRNCRLSALRGFAAHLLQHDIARADEYRRILTIPTKKATYPVITYLEPNEMNVLLKQPDKDSPPGARDFALLLTLYNTGARIAEALDIKPRDLYLTRIPVVRLRGKRNKERLCPIWAETAVALKRLLRPDQPPDDVVFRNARGEPLTRDGAAYLIDKYVARAAQVLPQVRRRRITPHVFRHSAAVAMHQSGCDLTAIRDFLGHASIASTNIYVKTNMKTKRDTLSSFWRRARLEIGPQRSWRPTPQMLSLLTSI
jgi:site-specific recombinase XerD